MAWTNTGTTDLFAEPTNGGQGFKAWSAVRTADGTNAITGYFLYTSTEFGGGNLNSDDNSCFGMYAKANGYTTSATRELMSPLMIGGTFTCKLGIQYRNGFKGVVLKAGTTDIFAFRAGLLGAGDEYQYATNNGANLGSYTGLGWSYAGDSVFTIAYNRTGEATAQVLIRQTSGSANNVTTVNLGATSTAIDRAQWFVANTSNDGQSNLYFNSLSAYNEWRY